MDLVFLSWLRRIDPAFLDEDLPGSWPLDPDLDLSDNDLDLAPPASSSDARTITLDRLPDDILLSLLDHLPRDAYLNLALASKLFFRLAHDSSAISRALRRWFGCLLAPSPPTTLSTHLSGAYTGFAIDRCTNHFDPYPMHLTLPPCPLSSAQAYRHLLSSTASHGEGHCHWPSLGNATTRLTSISHAPWSPGDRHAVAARFMRDRHADALTWTELDLLSPPPPPPPPPAAAPPPLPAAHVNQLALPNTYQAVALGPWMLGTFDPAQSQLSRGAFVLLASDAALPALPPALSPPPPCSPPPSLLTTRTAHGLKHGSTLLLRGLLANTHAPLALPNVTLTLTFHDPPLAALPFRTVLRRPPLLPGPIHWTGSIAVTPGVGAGSPALSGGEDHGDQGDGDAGGVMSSSGILLTGADDKDEWVHGIALDVAGCITTTPADQGAGGGAGGEEWHLYASLDHWQAQHDRAEARRKALGKAKGPGGPQAGGHVSEWSRTYAPLLDRITVRVMPPSPAPGPAAKEGKGKEGRGVRTRVVGWWKYPTLSCFFAEVDRVEHVGQGRDRVGKGKTKVRADNAKVVDVQGLSALGL